MIVTTLMIASSAAALQAAIPRTAGATLSVGATVVREPPGPAIAVERGAIVLRNVAGIAVAAEGGRVRRTESGTVSVTAGGAGPVTVTLTY